MKTGWFLLLLGLGALVGAGVMSLFMTRKTEIIVAKSSTREASAQGGGAESAADLAALREENVTLKSQVEDIQRRLTEAREQAAEDLAAEKQAADKARAEATALRKSLHEVAPELVEGGDVADHDESASAVPFHFDEFDVLDEVDWSSVGESMCSMVPLIGDLAEASAEGRTPDLTQAAKIQQFNAPLVQAAVSLAGKVPGSGINGSFTHPAFMVNAIASSLEAAGLALDDDQVKAMAALGRKFTDSEAARNRGYAEDTWALKRVLDECEAKDRFFDEAFALLTVEQSAALRPEAVKGILSFDIFSSGLVWAQHVNPVPFQKREDLEAQISQRLKSLVDADETLAGRIAEAVTAWVDAMPASLVTQQSPTAFGQPMLQVTDINACARAQLDHLGRLAQTLPLTGDALDKVRDFAVATVPLYRK